MGMVKGLLFEGDDLEYLPDAEENWDETMRCQAYTLLQTGGDLRNIPLRNLEEIYPTLNEADADRVSQAMDYLRGYKR